MFRRIPSKFFAHHRIYSTVSSARANRSLLLFKVVPIVLLGSSVGYYYYWKNVLVVDDKKRQMEYIDAHITQIIETAVKTGLQSVNDPNNIKKTLKAFNNSFYDDIECKAQLALIPIKPNRPNMEQDPKSFFKTEAFFQYCLLPEFSMMKEEDRLGDYVKLSASKPYTVINSRNCIVTVQVPITVDTPDPRNKRPVIGLSVQLSNLNSRLDKFVPNFFVTRVTLRDVEQAFPEAPHIVSNKSKKNLVKDIDIEFSDTVDGLMQASDGFFQVYFAEVI
ncbi:trm8 [Acrasis kona]|uniref:Trm8 n=1 Tax=Acrasis kona TaxID=1008807 RepID=A0AAW2ZIZ2_9EUKA